MPGRIRRRGFKVLRSDEIGEGRSPLMKYKAKLSLKISRGVSGRDGYDTGVQPMTGKERGEC